MNMDLYENTSAHLNVEKVVIEYAHLVKNMAYHLLSRLPKSVNIDDLIQSGMIGLIEASRKYDETKMASFETYANIRIRGTMLDELRKTSWMPRSVHQNMRRIANAIRTIENRTSREAQSHEIAKELGVNIDEYSEMASAAYANELFSFDELNGEAFNDDNSHQDPMEQTHKKRCKDYLSKMIADLPERERLILVFYYTEKLKFKEIGEVLGVGEARICQLHGQALARLKARMSKD